MNRETLIHNTLEKINQLPDGKIMEINDFVDFLLSKIDDKILVEGTQNLISNSKSFDYLNDDENLYTVNDLKEKYK